MGSNASSLPALGTLPWLWGYLIPVGLLILIWAGLSPRKARRVTPVAATAMALAILGYWAVGFALHMGGAYPVTEDPALQGLNRMLPLVPGDRGWGIAGLSGFFLSGEGMTPTVFSLFLTYLPLIAAAVTLVALALGHTRRWIMVTAGLLTGTLIVPLAACWMWGSGWLAHLGETMSLGHGFVDFGGSALILWLPGMVVLPILLLQPRAPDATSPSPPLSTAPLMANVGALLMGIGWLGWELAHPFHVAGATLDWQRAAVNALLGMAGATVTSQLYAWLALGKPESMLATQGLGAGWGAVLASAPFIPPWAAVVLGLAAGLLYPLLHYALQAGLKVRDSAGAVALALTGGPLGLLSVGLLADGRWGQGWNGIGLVGEAEVTGPGVTGLLVGGQAGQLSAQLVGLITLAFWGLLWGGILGVIAHPRELRRWAPRTLLQRDRSEEVTDSEAVFGSNGDELDVSSPLIPGATEVTEAVDIDVSPFDGPEADMPADGESPGSLEATPSEHSGHHLEEQD